MIVIVCGGRHYTDGAFLFSEMDRLHAELQITMVVEGGQRTYDKKTRRPIGGADFFANEWAVLRGVLVRTENARWGDLSHPDCVIGRNRKGEPYDKNAGFRRNQLMLDRFQPERVIGFRPGGGGTQDMLDRAVEAGVKIVELRAP